MSTSTTSSSHPVLPQPSTASPFAVASSSRLPETSVKKEVSDAALNSSSSSKKRKTLEADDDDDDDEDLDDSFSSAASPSKPSNTGGRRKASDEERKARLEARQARNRLSAQYSRERKKAYVEQLEGSVNSLKAENTLLCQQRDQDQLVRQALETKVKDAQIRINTLEMILRTVAPSLAPLLMSSSSSSSPSFSSSLPSSSSALAAPSTSAIAPQLAAGLTTDLASALLQNNSSAHKEVSLPLAIAAPASTASTSLSPGTSGQQTSNEDVRLPAAEATCSDAPSLFRDAELEQSQQRMSSQSSMVSLAPKPLSQERPEAMSMSMAAASSTKDTPSQAKSAFLQQSSRRRSRPAPVSLCLSIPLKRRQPASPVKLKLSSPTLSTSTPSSPTVTRRLRLKIKVPRRLPPRLNLYLWARSMQQQQQAARDQQTPLQVTSQA